MGTLEQLVTSYGIVAVFVGTFLEGETIVVIAGFLAHQSILNPYAVAFSAFGGSFFGDQLWFYIGRRHSRHRYVTRITKRPVFDKVLSAITDHPKKFILTFRFIYGIRTISPVAVGLSKVPASEFLVLNAIAAAIWAAAVTALGFLFGQVAQTFLGDLKAIEYKILGAIGGAVVLFILYQFGGRIYRKFRHGQDAATPSADDDPGNTG